MRGAREKKRDFFCAGSDEIKAQQPKTQKQTPWRPGLETYFSRDYRPKGGGVKILGSCPSPPSPDTRVLRCQPNLLLAWPATTELWCSDSGM